MHDQLELSCTYVELVYVLSSFYLVRGTRQGVQVQVSIEVG